MENRYKSQQEITVGYLEAGIEKAKKPPHKLFILGIMAGMFIALGASTSMVACHAIEDYGIAKLVAGVVFPIGLILIILVGGELFTGDCLMVLAAMNKKISFKLMSEKLLIIFLTNFMGAMFVVFLVSLSGQQDMGSGALGAYTIKVAIAKISLTPLQAFMSGVGCNIIVCAAMLLASTAIDTTGKVLGAYFPIMFFVVTGFEHCVANMYYIPAGIVAGSNSEYLQKAIEMYHITSEQFEQLSAINLVYHLLSVTGGNIVGGMVFIGIPLYVLHIKKHS